VRRRRRWRVLESIRLDVAGLVLRNSGGDDLTINANGAFTFATRVPLGGAYSVTAVAGTPASPRHVCQVANAAGLVPNAPVTHVQVTCEADRFAYVAHYNLNGPFSGSAITPYTQNHQSGALTLIAGTSTFATGSGATSIASDPRGRFIYVVNEWADTVSGFSVDAATGALTPVPGSPFAAGVRPRDVAIDSEGKFLYAAAWYSSEVYGWAIQADGSLVAVPVSPVSTMSGGSSSGPVSISMSQDQQCCYVYVAHQLALPAEFSAFAYDQDTGALSHVAGSPHTMPGLYSPTSVVANITGELVYVTASGTSNVATFDIAGGIGGGVLTSRAGSPTAFTPGACDIVQPRLSPSIFAASSNAYVIASWGTDVDTALPAFLSGASLDAGNYCTVASDPHGRFAYTTNNTADT
jgi:6-phosphogluconolactonase